MKRRTPILLLIAAMIAGLLAGCGGGSTNSASQGGNSTAQGGTGGTADGSGGAVDTSKAVNLTMYLLGDIPSDLDSVYENLNKILKEKINVTLKTNYLAWSDWQTKYSLTLASGEDVDLMYTSDWAYYSTEAAKGAFYELTDDFLNKYMPQTVKSQDPASLKQATINGKLFAMPKNDAGLEGETWIVIRKDLADKHAVGDIKNLSDLEKYFQAVATNESGILPYAASSDGGFERIAYTQPKGLITLTNTNFAYEYKGTNAAPEFSEINYLYFRDDAKPYFELMKKWADAGYWSKNAISNTEQVRDAFENGKSASLTWNATIFRAGENLEKNNPEWKPAYIDINPDTPRRQALYTNDCIAIAASSKNPERAGMFLDLVKNDKAVYLALVGGIEGKHYILNADGTRAKGPDAEKYPWNPSTWCFNAAVGFAPADSEASPIETEFVNAQNKYIVQPDIAAFRFDVEPVKSELAAIDALRDEYRPMLALGMVDVESTLAEWKQKAEAAGMPKIMAELEKQYTAWKSGL